MKTRVIIVRHGQSTYNLKKLIQGQIDLSVLTDLGIQQAQQVGATLKGIPYDNVYCSPLKRANQPANEIVSVLKTVLPDTPVPETCVTI